MVLILVRAGKRTVVNEPVSKFHIQIGFFVYIDSHYVIYEKQKAKIRGKERKKTRA